MSKKVLEFVRSELYMDLRFLDIALGTLVYRADENIRSFATDGTYLYFSTEQVLRVFQGNPKYLDRAYLHSVFALYLFSISGSVERETGKNGILPAILRWDTRSTRWTNRVRGGS